MDERSLAQGERRVRVERHQEGSKELGRSCFYCLEGWVFLGSIGHDGEEVIEAIRSRRCKGTGWVSHYSGLR